jgi:hypothetical protein
MKSDITKTRHDELRIIRKLGRMSRMFGLAEMATGKPAFKEARESTAFLSNVFFGFMKHTKEGKIPWEMNNRIREANNLIKRLQPVTKKAQSAIIGSTGQRFSESLFKSQRPKGWKWD